MKTQTMKYGKTQAANVEGEAALQLTQNIPAKAGFHIPHSIFTDSDAESKIFGPQGITSALPGQSGTVLTIHEERALFIQFNYCRYRVARLLEFVQEQDPIDPCQHEKIMKWHAAGQMRRNRIVECNLGLVVMMIRNFRMEGMDYDELSSEGNLTLLFAVDKFDVERGFRFSTYACQAIHHAMIQVATKRNRRTWATLSEDIDMAGESEDATRPQMDEIRQVHDIIHRNDAQLSAVELKVIRSRFALPTDMFMKSEFDPMTREQVGQLIGVSKVRIRQIERNAISKLRTVFKRSNVA